MRILIGVHHFPPRYTGGAELRALRTARALQARGHDVRVLTIESTVDVQTDEPERGANPNLKWDDDIYEGVRVRRLHLNMAAAPDPFRFEYDNPWIGAFLDEWLRTLRPTIFHLFSGYLLTGRALRVAHDCGIPTVLSLTDYWFICRRINLFRSNGELSVLPIDPARCLRCHAETLRRYRLLGHVAPKIMDAYWQTQVKGVQQFVDRKAFLLETLEQVDVMVSPSEFLRSVMVQGGVPDERIIVSRQGCGDGDTWVAPAAKSSTAERVLRLGYIGQISQHKGLHVLLQALKSIPNPNLQLRIYGDTGHLPRYARKIRSMVADDPRATLCDPFPASQLSHVFDQIDVLIVPSIWYENSPNVILEAFTMRTPVIVSDLGGMAELVRDGVDGLTFQCGDPQSLAATIRRLIDEPSLIRTLANGITPPHPVATEIDHLEQIYATVLRSRNEAGLSTPSRP